MYSPAPVANNLNAVASLIQEKLASRNLHPVVACRQDNVAARATVQNDGGGLLTVGSGVAKSHVVQSCRIALNSESDLVGGLLEASNVASACFLLVASTVAWRYGFSYLRSQQDQSGPQSR